MNDATFLSFAVGRSRFHDKEGTDRDIHCLDYDHVGEGDKFCTDQVVYSGDDGRQYLEDFGYEAAMFLGFRGVCLSHGAQDRGNLSIEVRCSLNEWVHNLAELVLYNTEAGRD